MDVKGQGGRGMGGGVRGRGFSISGTDGLIHGKVYHREWAIAEDFKV